MADEVLGKATRRDRRFVGWGRFGALAGINFLWITALAVQKPSGSGVWWALLGALGILCPLLGQHLGRWFLSGEVQEDPTLSRMIGWRLLCIAISIAPLLMAMVDPPM